MQLLPQNQTRQDDFKIQKYVSRYVALLGEFGSSRYFYRMQHAYYLRH